jgi:hypothetical protein
MMLSGIVGLLLFRKRPEKIQGITLRDFKWACFGLLIGGFLLMF